MHVESGWCCCNPFSISLIFFSTPPVESGTLMQGEYGLQNVSLSLPCVVAARGIEQVLTNTLTDDEEEGFRNSARVLREGLDAVGY
ncbi:hypothetical protein [Desulfonatronum thioautotrophicum]|uniref:hypothetical protein n=1 Tax=Desulfonatronum thioautotrophicum TaxID=617001 RepID=UPI001294702C|nr:hypothetical protein [Desulfonatronum thioautotrophicum]